MTVRDIAQEHRRIDRRKDRTTCRRRRGETFEELLARFEERVLNARIKRDIRRRLWHGAKECY